MSSSEEDVWRYSASKDVVVSNEWTPEGVTLSVFRRRVGEPASRTGILYIHGGGFSHGDRFSWVEEIIDLVADEGFMAVTVEYRLAPEHTYPAALEDCHAALRWMRSNYERLSIDIDRIVLFGVSAGGGLAASLALKVRDGREPQLLGQLLSCPMLDNATREPKEGASPRVDTITWTYEDNRMAWAAYLGRTSAAIAVPAQAGSLVGLPRTFIDVGTWDIFLSEDVAYTRRLTEAGVDTELHVWSRGYHGFDLREPELSASKLAIAARHRWLRDLVLGDRS